MYQLIRTVYSVRLPVRPPRPVTRINVSLKLYQNIFPFQEKELEKTEKFVVKCKSLCRGNFVPNCYAISLTIEENTCLGKTQTGISVRKW